MDLKDIIRDYRAKTGENTSQIARKLNVARSTVIRWENGSISRLSHDICDRLSELVGYNVRPIIDGIDTSIRLPILGYVKGGYDLFGEENYLGEEEATLRDRKDGDYYLQVSGDSMSGIGIMDGSLVLVQKTDVLQSGDIGVIMIDDEVTVKKVIMKRNLMILEAANPAVESRYFTSAEIRSIPVRIIGKVISCKTYY